MAFSFCECGAALDALCSACEVRGCSRCSPPVDCDHCDAYACQSCVARCSLCALWTCGLCKDDVPAECVYCKAKLCHVLLRDADGAGFFCDACNEVACEEACYRRHVAVEHSEHTESRDEHVE